MGDPHERVLEFSRPSHVYRTCDVRCMRKLAEVAKEFVRGEIRGFLRRHESDGVMVQYGACGICVSGYPKRMSWHGAL